MKVRSPKSEIRSFFAAFVAVVIAVSVQAATNSATNDEFVLRPPYQEMPPTYWEQHGNAVILLSVLGVIVLGLLVCFLLRSRTKMRRLTCLREN